LPLRLAVRISFANLKITSTTTSPGGARDRARYVAYEAATGKTAGRRRREESACQETLVSCAVARASARAARNLKAWQRKGEASTP
jgi:hypothetical protein